jgi:hypothetical protein
MENLWMPFGVSWPSFFRVVYHLRTIGMSTVCHLAPSSGTVLSYPN